MHIKELKRTLKGLFPNHYSQMVINVEGMLFASEKAAGRFGEIHGKAGVKGPSAAGSDCC
jgi:hypothetical protein